MGKNIGTLDRTLRIILGLALVGLAALGILGPWAYVGVVPLLTALVGFCPLYRIFGWSSCKVSQKS